jgi:hypothetical protein
MSARIELSFVEFIALSSEIERVRAFRRGRFWCETGAVRVSLLGLTDSTRMPKHCAARAKRRLPKSNRTASQPT